MRSVKDQVWDPVYEIWYRVGDQVKNQALSRVPTSVWSQILDPVRNEVKDHA